MKVPILRTFQGPHADLEGPHADLGWSAIADLGRSANPLIFGHSLIGRMLNT